MSSILSLHEDFTTNWTPHGSHMLTQGLVLITVERSLAPLLVIQAIFPLPVPMATLLTRMFMPVNQKVVDQILSSCENLAAPRVITRVCLTWDPVYTLHMEIKLTLVRENSSAHRTHPAVVVNIKHVHGELMEHSKKT